MIEFEGQDIPSAVVEIDVVYYFVNIPAVVAYFRKICCINAQYILYI